jgi:hypothetical protein
VENENSDSLAVCQQRDITTITWKRARTFYLRRTSNAWSSQHREQVNSPISASNVQNNGLHIHIEAFLEKNEGFYKGHKIREK